MRISPAFVFGLLCATQATAQNRLTNSQEIYDLVKSSGTIHPSFEGQNLSQVRVAIIDYGFEGFRRYGRDLGPNVKIINAAVNEQSDNKHGYAMAQIFMAASGALWLPSSMQPQLMLIEANGLTEFSAAIDQCVGKNGRPAVDLVIHSRNFPWGSDFNGGGFFNAEVARATRAGITWINSAGNNGNATYFGKVLPSSVRNEIKLPGQNNALHFESRFDDQNFEIVLSWNDFRSDSEYATKKDLDFAVFAAGSTTALEGGIANKQQRGKHPTAAGTNSSGNAFESLAIRLPERGKYFIKIYDRSKNFGTRDRFQVQIIASNPESLEFLDKNRENEITAPADHPDVIAVGVPSEFSSIQLLADQLAKPDVILNLAKSDLRFEYSDSFSTGLDTSSAAAIFGGVIANLKAADPEFSTDKLLDYARTLSQRSGSRGPLWMAPLIQSAPSSRSATNNFPAPRPKRRSNFRAVGGQ